MPRWIQLFHQGSADDRDRLGGKGANLAEMTNLGLPVPPGFTITTNACRAYLENDRRTPSGLWDEVRNALAEVERRTNRRFGDPACPLLLSVRSGAKHSMPGMMDTVLNIGLTDATLPGLAALYDERLALDCARRLQQMFGTVVLGLPAREYEAVLAKFAGVGGQTDRLDLTARRQLLAAFTAIPVLHGLAIPDDPFAHLEQAITAVFASWNTLRAVAYRRSQGIADDLGTAVNVQAMVFGNVGADSATGVAFTRDPNTGAAGLFGEVLVDAQGEDVVAGIRTPQPIASMAAEPRLRPAYDQLLEIADRLERHFRDMQDMEFTVERGKLWLLQTRTGKRTAQAAIRIAIDQAEEGLIDRAAAVRRVEPAQLERQLHPNLDESQPLSVIATGLPASPGAASGRVVFDPLEARQRGEQGEAVILVRRETSADDFPGMERAQGILTARGGMTSHAAVVARGIGKPAVTGCAEIEIDEASGTFTAGEVVVHEGDELTIDGSTGRVILGHVRTIPAGLGGETAKLLAWADRFRHLAVRANADTPADAARAREFGAEGIGLCRTEHMFFGDGRIDLVRDMILAESTSEREQVLVALEALQVEDFAGIFRAMDGYPVTIRTLDPPLHEFLPRDDEEVARFATRRGLTTAEVRTRIDAHRESNPMLGHRGCRLGITFPEITAMQARAVYRAALDCTADGVIVEPEVMIPFVSDAEELRLQREVVVSVAERLFAETGRRVPVKIGTMIEVPRAALLADRIAAHADFISFGTNDLTQTTFGLSRDDSGRFLPDYVAQGILPSDPFQTLDRSGVGRLIEIATTLGYQARPDLKVGLCGEHGGEPSAVAFCDDLGIDYVSCSPYRVPIARLAAAQAALASPDGSSSLSDGRIEGAAESEQERSFAHVGDGNAIGYLD
ncbi:MAG: pyruvate, orthophosphate dikinase [Thermomicrobiales bacterium]|nr:pyruvate, orthophosphate dikinase [Thermomicrobiales bacterium]